MGKILNYCSAAAAVIGIIALIVAGLKIAGNHYDIVCQGIIIGICFVVLLISAVYKIVKQNK